MSKSRESRDCVGSYFSKGAGDDCLMKKRYLAIAALLVLLAFASTACGSSPSGKLLEKGIKNNVYLEGENLGGLKESEALQKVKNYAAKLNMQAENAALNRSNWEIEKVEKAGRNVNIEKTMDTLLNSAEGGKISLAVEEVKPEITSEKLGGGIVEIGAYTTKLIDKQESRVNNIELAAQKIDYKKLSPGEEFSFNKTVGKRTAAKGFEQAPIIIKTQGGYKKGYGVGGGICQLATTLYNAVEQSGMEITERHLHSKDVGYVPDGKDATVSYGGVDFRFKNNKNFPVMIRVYSGKNTLSVTLLENRN